MKRYFIKIAYNGSDFFGWQTQPNERTVQDVLTEVLQLTLSVNDIKLTGCGRTDTGVHASNYFAHFELPNVINDVNKTIYKLNNFLPHSISILEIIDVHKEAHARFDAKSRTYHYFIHQKKNPFIDQFSLLVLRELDVERMNTAASILIDCEDFSSFSKLGSDNKSVICKVSEAKWELIDDQLRFSISADRFLRNMVRAIVGTLLEVGLHKISVDDFETIAKSRSRKNAGSSAPAHALFLSEIKYDFISA